MLKTLRDETEFDELVQAVLGQYRDFVGHSIADDSDSKKVWSARLQLSTAVSNLKQFCSDKHAEEVQELKDEIAELQQQIDQCDCQEGSDIDQDDPLPQDQKPKSVWDVPTKW